MASCWATSQRIPNGGRTLRLLFGPRASQPGARIAGPGYLAQARIDRVMSAGVPKCLSTNDLLSSSSLLTLATGLSFGGPGLIPRLGARRTLLHHLDSGPAAPPFKVDSIDVSFIHRVGRLSFVLVTAVSMPLASGARRAAPAAFYRGHHISDCDHDGVQMRTNIEINGALIRYRSRSGLRPFPSDCRFELHEDEGSIDRLLLEYTVDVGYTDQALLAEYVEHVSGRSGSLPWTLMSIDPLTNNLQPKVRTAAPTEVSGGRWIVEVSGKLSNTRAQHGGVARLRFTLHVNPTTFIANQPASELSGLGDLQSHEAFLANPEMLAEARAASCDGNHNLLVGAARRGGTSFDRRDQWYASVIDAVVFNLAELLQQQLVPSAENGLPTVSVTIRSPTVSQAEVYWEFESADAISDVLTIGDRLSLAAGQVSIRQYFPNVHHMAVGHSENSPSVTIDLSRSSGRIKLLVYAKTRQIVRIEVKYLKELRQTVARTARGTLDVQTILGLARRHAFQQVERMREAVMQVTPSVHERADLLTFLRHISAAALGDAAVEQGMLTLLVNIGAVSQTDEQGACPPEVCNRLRRSGVVRRVRVRHGGPPRYALTPAYAALVALLHEARPNYRELRAERAGLPLS